MQTCPRVSSNTITASLLQSSKCIQPSDIWLSGNSIDEKRAALKDIFDADMPARLLEKEVNMCNYSDFVENRGIKKGRKKGKAEDLVNLMDSLKLSLEQAMNSLKIPESEWDDYRKLVADLEVHPAS